MRVVKVENRGNIDPLSMDWNVRVTLSDGSTLEGVAAVSRDAGYAGGLAQITITILDSPEVEWVGPGAYIAGCIA